MVKKLEHAWSYPIWVCELKSMDEIPQESTTCDNPGSDGKPNCPKCSYRLSVKVKEDEEGSTKRPRCEGCGKFLKVRKYQYRFCSVACRDKVEEGPQ